MNRKTFPALRRCSCMLAVLALLAPWTIPQASAHPYWPPRPTIKALAAKDVNGKKVYRLELKFNLASLGTNMSSLMKHYTTMGLNWCFAKDVLPAGWDTQDDRRLRTSSMCKGPAQYSSLGIDYPFDWKYPTGNKKWTTPDNYSFKDGRYVFSLNGWCTGSHGHGGGNHTTLHLFNIDVPDGKTPPSN